MKLLVKPEPEEDISEWSLPAWAAKVRSKKYPPWLVSNLFRSDNIILLSGAPKLARKTFLAIACAVAISTGRAVGDVTPQSTGPVLLILEEGSAHATLKRLEQMLALVGYNGLPDNIHIQFKEALKLDKDTDLKRILKAVEKISPVLVVLDPLAQVMSGDENSQEDIRLIVDAMKLIQKAGTTEESHGPAVMLLCHLNKTAGGNEAIDIDAQLRGSSALAGCYDVHLAVRGTKSKLKLTVRAKEEEELQYSLQWQSTTTPRLMKLSEDEALTIEKVKSRRK